MFTYHLLKSDEQLNIGYMNKNGGSLLRQLRKLFNWKAKDVCNVVAYLLEDTYEEHKEDVHRAESGNFTKLKLMVLCDIFGLDVSWFNHLSTANSTGKFKFKWPTIMPSGTLWAYKNMKGHFKGDPIWKEFLFRCERESKILFQRGYEDVLWDVVKGNRVPHYKDIFILWKGVKRRNTPFNYYYVDIYRMWEEWLFNSFGLKRKKLPQLMKKTRWLPIPPGVERNINSEKHYKRPRDPGFKKVDSKPRKYNVSDLLETIFLVYDKQVEVYSLLIYYGLDWYPEKIRKCRAGIQKITYQEYSVLKKIVDTLEKPKGEDFFFNL